MKSTLNKYSNLTQRVIAGVIGAALLIVGITWSFWSFWAIFAAIALLSLREFYGLLRQAGHHPAQDFGMGIGIVLLLLFSPFPVKPAWLPVGYQAFVLLCAVFFSLMIYKLYDAQDKTPFQSIAYTFLGWVYAVLPYLLFMKLGAGSYQEKGADFSFQLPLGFLFLLWASDSGAYFAGKRFGKHKLFERISPKKTWEGSIGGALLSLAVAVLLGFSFQDLAAWKWVVMSLLIVVFGSWGDLVESMLKRSLQIKDSGSSIPGHGGFLDRFDGLLVAVSFVILFLEYSSF